MLGIACGGEGRSPAAYNLQWWPSLPCPPNRHLCGVPLPLLCQTGVSEEQYWWANLVAVADNSPVNSHLELLSIRMQRFPWPSIWRTSPGHQGEGFPLAIKTEMPWPCCRHSQLHPAPASCTEDRGDWGRWGDGCLTATGGPETISLHAAFADFSALQEVGQGLGHTPSSPAPGVCTSSYLVSP